MAKLKVAPAAKAPQAVPGAIPPTPRTVPLTLATADLVHVTGLPGELEEKLIPGAQVARLLAAAESGMFSLVIIARELDGIASLVGQLADGSGNDDAGPYFLELALQSIARRVEAMDPGLPAHAFHVRPTEAAR